MIYVLLGIMLGILAVVIIYFIWGWRVKKKEEKFFEEDMEIPSGKEEDSLPSFPEFDVGELKEQIKD